jgi:phosphoserine phosphatase
LNHVYLPFHVLGSQLYIIFGPNVQEPIIDADRKADLVHMLAMQEGVEAEQVIAVGDGPVSTKMLAAAGMSIAFDQPGSVQDLQTGRISSKSLAGVFYLLGVTGRDFRELGRA